MYRKYLKRSSGLIKSILKASLAASFFVSVAQAQPDVYDAPDMNLGIHDNASYLQFRDALFNTEFTRVDYALDPKPRVAASVAALLVFATNNPLADEADLQNFVDTYSATLEAFNPADPDLNRSANFMAAVRRHDRLNHPAFEGFDTRVGRRVLDLLGVAIAVPDGIATTDTRMVEFKFMRVRPFENSAGFGQLLLLGFYSQDLETNSVPNLWRVLKIFVNANGYEAYPDFVDDERFDAMISELAQTPFSYAGYAALLAEVNSGPAEYHDSTLRTNIESCFESLDALNNSIIINITAEMLNPPSLEEAAMNDTDPQIVDAHTNIHNDWINIAARDRAGVNWNAMVLLQSDQAAARTYATTATEVSDSMLTANGTLADVRMGIELATGLGSLGAGIAAKDPGAIIGGASAVTGTSLSIAERLGLFGDSPPSPEQQIFDQIIQVGQDIEEMRVQMHDRFDAVEEQIVLVFDEMNDSFEQIKTVIQVNFFDQKRLMAISLGALDRIEDVLWALAKDIFTNDLAILTNTVLNYRYDNDFELFYELPGGGGYTFVNANELLYTWETVTAKNQSIGGLDSIPTSVADAYDSLGANSINKHVNGLRTFPERIWNLGNLSNSRVVGAAPWTQGAAVYSQLAAENPWYFARRHQSQLDDPGGSPTDLYEILQEGINLSSMMAAGRNQDLFDAIFDEADNTINQVQSREGELLTSFISTQMAIDYVDLADSVDQPSVEPSTGPSSAALRNSVSLYNYDLANFNGQTTWSWEYFSPGGSPGNVPALLWALFYNDNAPLATNPYSRWTAEHVSGNTVTFTMYTYISSGTGFDVFPGRTVTLQFWNLGGSAYSFGFGAGDTQSDRNFEVTEYFRPGYFEPFGIFMEQGVWNYLRSAMLDGTNLAGESVSHVRFFHNKTALDLDVTIVSDAGSWGESLSRQVADEYLLDLYSDYWSYVSLDPIVLGLRDGMLDARALLDAYATMSMPDMMEQSPLAQSALRGNDSQGGLNIAFDFFAYYGYRAADPRNELAGGATELLNRVSTTQEVFNNYLAEPVAAKHGYVEWMIAELAELQENALNLAIDDRYLAGPSVGTGENLVVSAAYGLLANDIDQPVLVPNKGFIPQIEVDLSSVTQPASGIVVVNADGSFGFTYTGSHGSSQPTTSFSYRAMRVDSDGRIVLSAPATVVIELNGALPTFVRVPADCPTIAQAIALIADSPTSVIELAPGTHVAQVDLGSKRFTLRSQDPSDPAVVASTIIRSGSVVFISSTGDTGPETVIDGVTITSGGRACEMYGAMPTFRRCWFVDCGGGTLRGGAMELFNQPGSMLIDSCTFVNNSSARGGAIFVSVGASPKIINSVFVGNTASLGGAIYIGNDLDMAPEIDACTFYGNSAMQGATPGAAVYVGDTPDARVWNSILRGNSPDQIFFGGDGGLIVRSNVEGGGPPGHVAGSVFDADAMFVDAAGGDFRLLAGSPCIDAARDSSYHEYGGPTDRDSNPRFVDDPDTDDTGWGVTTIMDIGAYEYQGVTFVRVPDDALTIQLAISMIVDNPVSVIELAPVIYREHIDTQGKAFTLRSASGDPTDTIISGDLDGDGVGDGRVVHIHSGEDRDTVLQGLTIRDGRTGGGFGNTSYGAGMRITDASPSIIDCVLTNNHVTDQGGGGAVQVGAGRALFVNCLFYENSADFWGGGMSNTGTSSNSFPVVMSCTFVDNAADLAHQDETGGAFRLIGNQTIIYNCILWGNTPDSVEHGGGNPTIGNSLVQGSMAGFTDGGGNIGGNPLFVNRGANDYRLDTGSPVIDAGDNTQQLLAGILTDLGGDPRFADDVGTPDTGIGTAPVIDMGAYEFQGTTANCAVDFNNDGTLNFFDVSEFLQLFSDEDPTADLNEDERWNFFDVSTFLQAFAAGCP